MGCPSDLSHRGKEFETLASWFEAGEAVQRLLQPLRTRKRRIEAVSVLLLPTRREFWAERSAWMGATLKEGAAKGSDPWCDFARGARSGRPTAPCRDTACCTHRSSDGGSLSSSAKARPDGRVQFAKTLTYRQTPNCVFVSKTGTRSRAWTRLIRSTSRWLISIRHRQRTFSPCCRRCSRPRILDQKSWSRVIGKSTMPLASLQFDR
jgi:hypothetical protein